MSNGSPASGAHQFYITHCARSDSVLNTVGFSVRAASAGSNDPELLKLAMEYPAYELPMEMWAKKPNRCQAPRRLARVRTPVGVMVVHTSYLEKDTMNRDRSYFSHVVILPSASPVEVLQSWNAYHWKTDYQTGETKELPRAACPLPAGPALSRGTATNFLNSKDLGTADSLALAYWNETLQQNDALRRDLVGRVICGILRAMQDPVRNRLFILAEPGVVAALIYAASQVLPPPVVGDLTFTTYEPAHRGLKDFKRALVVGTYLPQPSRGLDAELVHQRGYVVDCFHPERGSPELRKPLPGGIEKLLDWAAGGQWESIEKVQSVSGTRVRAPEDLERSVALAEALDRLEVGKAIPADLILLQQDDMGRKRLEQKKEDLWPKILDLALNDDLCRDSIRKAFRPWFTWKNRIDEIAELAFTALRDGDAETWDAHWELLRSVFDQSQSTGAIERLLMAQRDEIVHLSLDGRRSVRASLKSHGNLNPQALAILFSPVSSKELDELLSEENLPPNIIAFAAYAARCTNESEMRKRVSAFLANASADALGEYARLALKNQERREIARELFAMDANGKAPYLDRLLNPAAKYVAPSEWLWFAKEQKLCMSGHQIESTMLQQHRLSKLLFAVCREKEAQPIWDIVYKEFTIDFLGKTTACEVWKEIKGFKEMLQGNGLKDKEPIPVAMAKRLQAAEVLQKVFETGVAARSDEIKTNLTEAFRAFDCDPAVGLDYFFKWLGFDTDLRNNQTKLDRFATIFSVFFPPSEDNLKKCKLALQNWIRLNESNPESQKQFQMYYFSNKILRPESSEQCLSLIAACKSELNPEVVAKIEVLYRRTASAKSSKRKKTARRRMSNIRGLVLGGLLLLGLPLLGAIGGYVALNGFLRIEKTTGNESTSPSLNEGKPNPPPKALHTTKGIQPVAQKTNLLANKEMEFVIKTLGATNRWQFVMAIVPLSPLSAELTNTLNPPMALPLTGVSKIGDSSADKLKECKAEKDELIKALVNLYDKITPETQYKEDVGEHITKLSKIHDDYLKLATTEAERGEMKNILADWKKMDQNLEFLAINPLDFAPNKKGTDYSVSGHLQKADKLCGELRTKEARQALKTATEKSLLGYLPGKLKLDSKLFVDSGLVNRDTVSWKNKEMKIPEKLTDDPTLKGDPSGKPNECWDNKNQFVWLHNGKIIDSDNIQPTETSKIAFKYTQAREQLETKGFLKDEVSMLETIIKPSKPGDPPYIPFNVLDEREKSNNKPGVYDRIKIVVEAFKDPKKFPNLFPKDEKTPMAPAP